MMARCSHCRRWRDRSAFGWARGRKRALPGWCAECKAKAERLRRVTLGDRYRAQGRAYYRANREKYLAKMAARRAVLAGKITPPARCECCAKRRKLEKHHAHGYARRFWLTVAWLCRSCHALAHAERRRIA